MTIISDTGDTPVRRPRRARGTVLDPANSFAQAKIITGDGEFLLWRGSLAEQNAANRVSEERAIPFVTSISMEVGRGLSGKISVGIYAGFEVGLEILESELMMIGNIIAVQFSYPSAGLVLPWYEGVTSKPDFDIGSEGFTATINGEGAAFAASRSAGVQTWENETYAAIIEEIATKETNLWNLRLPRQSGGEDPLYTARPRVTQGGRDDWHFIGLLARSAGCDISFGYASDVGGNELRVTRRAATLSAPPDYTFVMRGQVDFETRFPLMSAKSSGEGSWLPRGNARVTYGDIDLVTGEDVSGEINQEDLDEPRLSEGGVGAGNAAQPQGANIPAALIPEHGEHVYAPAADTSENPGQVAEREVSEAREGGGIMLDIESYGVPGLWPEDITRVEGLGWFSGNYKVNTLRHEWSGTWTMAANLIMNSQGMAGAVSELAARPWENFNDQEGTGASPGEDAEVSVPVENPRD